MTAHLYFEKSPTSASRNQRGAPMAKAKQPVNSLGLIESEPRLQVSVFRVFFTRTGTHFARKRLAVSGDVPSTSIS
jgi:hypothetical protein